MVRLNGTKRRAPRGFTLIEVMIVVVVIAILAAVVIPQFMGSSRKVKAETEVTPMFAEISIRQEQERSESDAGAYAPLALCPTTTSPAGVAASTCTGSAEWLALRINPPVNTLRCTYQTWTGTAVGTNNPGGFTWSSPAVNWYYTIATCDSDGQGGTNSTYFMASSDSQIQKLNEGQ